VLIVGREKQDRRSFFQRERLRLGAGNIQLYGGVMGDIIIGTPMSLDGLMNDRADMPREERKQYG
jgi:hypothetical protein